MRWGVLYRSVLWIPYRNPIRVADMCQTICFTPICTHDEKIGRAGIPEKLPGGDGRAYRVDDLVFKPVKEIQRMIGPVIFCPGPRQGDSGFHDPRKHFGETLRMRAGLLRPISRVNTSRAGGSINCALPVLFTLRLLACQ